MGSFTIANWITLEAITKAQINIVDFKFKTPPKKAGFYVCFGAAIGIKSYYMQQEIVIENRPVKYSVRLSRRAKRMRIAVYSDSSVILTLPFGFRGAGADKFIRQKFSWIKKSLDHFRRFPVRKMAKSSRRDYITNRSAALELAKNKVVQWNKFFGFHYNRVNIKNQKTRWGSCSKKGNLNFNYKIVHLPEKLTDYLVVHELCHLKEFNHSKNFWELVGSAIPDYKNLRKQLRGFGVGAI